MSIVLYELCYYYFVEPNRLPCSLSFLCDRCGCSFLKTKRELNKLKKLGYVSNVKYCFGTFAKYLVCDGYALTDKAKDTQEYKNAFAEINWYREMRSFR